MKNFAYTRYVLLFILGLALHLHQGFSISSPLDQISSDMRGYVERALRIAVGDRFVTFDVFYPPGASYVFSVFFWLFGFATGTYVLMVFQCVLLAINPVLVGLTAEELFHNKRAAFFVTVLVACYWPFSAYASFFMSEPLFMSLSLLGQYLLLRTLRGSGSFLIFFIIGLTLSAALLVKGQGLGFVAAAIGILALPRYRHFRPYLLSFFLGLLFFLAPQMALNNVILPDSGLYFAANDAFNTYLGQSRREGLGCLDRSGGYYYIFHNNNSYFDHRLHPPMTLERSILDREYFKEETNKLWQQNPSLQLIRSLHSIVEMFQIMPHWPLRNIETFARYDRFFQQIAFFLVSLPVLYSLAWCLNRKAYRLEVFALLTPIVVMSAIAFLSMGQPRYLVPFKFNLFILTVPAYLEAAKMLNRLLRG